MTERVLTGKRVLVTGATGYLGRRLVARLERPVVLTRDIARARAVLGDVEAHAWEPLAGPPPARALEGVDVVFHLAGEPLAMGGWWTAEKKARIRDSRVVGTRHLVEALRASRPGVLVSASAVGFYGPRGDEVLEEGSAPGTGFLAGLCREWEEAASAAEGSGWRVVTPRFGMVLGESGGFLGKLLGQFRVGLGGCIGDDDPWMPWAHEEDVLGLLLHAATCPTASGPLNATAPEPVRNREFTRTLASLLRRPALFHYPSGLLRLALGEMAGELVVSQRVVPRAAERSGYVFRYPGLEQALRALLHLDLPAPPPGVNGLTARG
jgi:uncharacterized protein (TIGR01777 family)